MALDCPAHPIYIGLLPGLPWPVMAGHGRSCPVLSRSGLAWPDLAGFSRLPGLTGWSLAGRLLVVGWSRQTAQNACHRVPPPQIAWPLFACWSLAGRSLLIATPSQRLRDVAAIVALRCVALRCVEDPQKILK